jgi:ribosome biogenesis GTPase
MLVITKTDLAPPTELLALYGPLDVPLYLIAGKQVPAELVLALHDQISVLVGHSGVGKSTLVNNLVPSAERSTGHVNAVTGKGRHTSTSVMALHLPGGGWIIDTPGIRSFGLAHVDLHRIITAFPDLDVLTGGCPRACSHDEPECALNSVEDPGIKARIDSLRRLIRSRSIDDEQQVYEGGNS